MVRRLILDQEHIQRPPFPATTYAIVGLSGISTPFEMLSQSLRQIIYALLTRAPLNERASSFTPFDLHVLGTPPAFVLSQDQTLQFELPVSNLLLAFKSFLNCMARNSQHLLFGFQRTTRRRFRFSSVAAELASY